MLWPLSWDDVNCRSMFHTLEMNSHALTVVMRRCQLSEHVSYLRDEKPCSDRSHETMSTVGACFIPSGWITMLWPLSWDDDNCLSMFHTLEMNNHALTVVLRRWQLTEHVSYLRNENPCSGRCHVTMTTVGACFIPSGWITMLWPLSWDDDNCRSMFHTLEMNDHALTVVMRRWQLTEHVSYLRNENPCSDHCHVTMTTVGACFISSRWTTMLWPLSWGDDN